MNKICLFFIMCYEVCNSSNICFSHILVSGVQQYGTYYLAWQHQCTGWAVPYYVFNLCILHTTVSWKSAHGWSIHVLQRREWMLFQVLVHSFMKECPALLSLNTHYNHFCGWPTFVHLLKEYSRDTSAFPSSLGSKCRWNTKIAFHSSTMQLPMVTLKYIEQNFFAWTWTHPPPGRRIP